MVRHSLLFALAAAGLVSALPLNINLGAYSPALVVGDGEISFGGAQSAGELMETLASGAATAGGTQQAQGGAGAQQPRPATAGEGGAAPQGQVVPPPTPNTNAAAVVSLPQPDAAALQVPPVTEAVPNNEAAVNPIDTNSLVSGMISNNMDPALKRPNMARRGVTTVMTRDAPETSEQMLKREIAGFREALNYAREAMKSQPKVELGTGREGSGVGVIVNPGLSVPAGSPAAGTPPAQAGRPAKRYVAPGSSMGAPAEQAKSGITLMAIAEI